MRNNGIKLIAAALTLAAVLVSDGCKKSTVVKTTTTAPSGPVELKVKWPAGRHMVQNFDLKENNEMTVPGTPAPMRQTMNMEQKYGMTVLPDRSDGKHEVEFEFLSSHMMMKMGEKVMMDTDSSAKLPNGQPNPAGDVFKKLSGAKIRIVLDASNQVESVEGIDALQSRLGGGGANDPTGALKSMFKQMMNFGRYMPTKAVAPGDTWPVQLEVEMGNMGTMVLDYTYTLKNWELRNDRYCAHIGVEGTIKTKPGDNPQMPGMNIAIDNGTSSGETWFDLDMGMYVETSLNQEMKMTITVPNRRGGGAPNAPKNMTITGDVNQVINIKLDSVQ